MESIELSLGMLLAVLVSGYVVRALPIALPLPVVQIALGGLIAGVLSHGVTLQPEVFFLLFLPPLLFLDGWRIPKDGLLRDKGIILQLALGLVVFTVLGAGYFIHWMIPAMPLAVAFALAAIISPTDPVAVAAVTSRIPLPRRLMHILEGESLLNDASGLVCFQFAVLALLTGSFSVNSALVVFLWLAIAGLVSGAVLTLLIAFIQQWLTRRFGSEGGTSILVNLLTPFGAYLLAEQLHASGILAAVAAGITMSYVELSGRSMVTTRLERSAVWDTLQFTLNGIMFVLLGEQLPSILRGAITAVHESGHQDTWWLAVYAVVITLVLLSLRFVWVWLLFTLHPLQRGSKRLPTSVRLRLMGVTSLAGVRGAITLAGVLTLPLLLSDGTPFPARGLAIFLAASVILLSLLGSSVVLPPLLRGLNLPLEAAEQQEEDLARSAAANAAIESVRRTQQEIELRAETLDPDLCADAASRVIALYQKRLHDDDQEGGGKAADRLRVADALEQRLRLAALRAEREAILGLARRRQISDATSRKLVRQLDILESLYQ